MDFEPATQRNIKGFFYNFIYGIALILTFVIALFGIPLFIGLLFGFSPIPFFGSVLLIMFISFALALMFM